MKQVLERIADGQSTIYGLLSLILLVYLGRALFARREQRRALFKLVREQARTRFNSSVLVLAVALLIMATVFGSSTFLLPALDPPPTPTPTTLPATATVTPTSTSFAPTATPPVPTPTLMVIPTQEPATPTLAPTRMGKPRVVPPNTPVIGPPACSNPSAQLISPGVNQEVQGNVPIRGTANIAGFQYYKIEVGAGADPQVWQVLGQLYFSPVVGGVLEIFRSGAYVPGAYTLRLVVVDQTGNYPEPCPVTVIVKR